MREQASAALLPHDLGDSSSGLAASLSTQKSGHQADPLPQSTIAIAKYAVSATRLTPTSTTEPNGDSSSGESFNVPLRPIADIGSGAGNFVNHDPRE